MVQEMACELKRYLNFQGSQKYKIIGKCVYLKDENKNLLCAEILPVVDLS